MITLANGTTVERIGRGVVRVSGTDGYVVIMPIVNYIALRRMARRSR